MEHNSPHLQIIGQLAREYDEKYRDLEKLISKIQPEIIPLQLRALSERTVDRFRSAQVAMLSTPELFEGKEKETALQAMVALCRAFDEMHMLFNFLFDATNDRSKGCESA
jgi:hypothetical protein